MRRGFYKHSVKLDVFEVMQEDTGMYLPEELSAPEGVCLYVRVSGVYVCLCVHVYVCSHAYTLH